MFLHELNKIREVTKDTDSTDTGILIQVLMVGGALGGSRDSGLRASAGGWGQETREGKKNGEIMKCCHRPTAKARGQPLDDSSV